MLWARFLLVVALDLASGAPAVGNNRSLIVSRHYHGDLFTFKERTGPCGASFCSDWGGPGAVPLEEAPCRCRCEPPYPTYREDTGACVNDIQECHLAHFSMGDTQEKMPFVFMPERGQLVHPSAEITMSGLTPDQTPVIAPVCVVSGSEVISRSGWLAVNSTFEPPFRLNRDQDKTFLQWVGEGVSPDVIEGRVVLVRLLCKDAANQQRPRFSPCVAFRVAGTQGQTEAISQAEEGGTGSLAVGLSIGAVLLLYVLAMAGYLVYRRRKRRAGHQLIEDALMGKTSRGLSGGARERQSRRKKDNRPDSEEPTDLTQRSASSLTHGSVGSGEVNERPPQDTLSALEDAECDANVFDDDEDDRGQGSQLRRRLFFNPSFFDPDLLHDPPPGALEFLTKIREMITIAKVKMQAKQYLPTLPSIAEVSEEESDSAGSRTSSACQPSIDIDRWLETVVRESNSDSEPLYSDQSVPLAVRRVKKAAPPPPPAPAAAPTTSWRQQARQLARDDTDSDTLVGESGDDPRRAATNASFDSDDTLNDLVSEAESKVPKLHSDEDSEVYSELPAPVRPVGAAAPRPTAAAGDDAVYEDITMSDKSLSAFSGEYTSVSINGDGTVIRTGGKMTIEVDDTAALASDAESEEVFDPDTLEKRRIRVRKARKVSRKPSFYDDSLERRKRGVNYEEKFETTHINVNTVLNTSVESSESVYKHWGSVVSGSDTNSVYSRINFVSGKPPQPRGLLVGNLRHSQRKLKTFKDYSSMKFGGRTSLLDQWKKKNDLQRGESATSGASSMSQSSSSSAMSPPPAQVVSPSAAASRAGGAGQQPQPTPPIPPKAPAVPVPAADARPPADRTTAPPLPPRTHSPQRERAVAAAPAVSPSLPPRPPRAVHQPPLPPKSCTPLPSPPPLPSKTRPAPAPPPSAASPPPPPTSRRYFLGQIDGAANAGPHASRRRRNSAGESETNSTASSHNDEAVSIGSAGTDKSDRASHTLGRQVETRLERHLHRSYSTSDVSRSEVESLTSSRSSLRSPPRGLPNVLERITECETAIRCGAGAGTGMAIALGLRERQEAATERPSMRQKWRRLVELPPAAGRDDSGYQSTDSAESHRPPTTGGGGGIRRLVSKFDRTDQAGQPTSPSRTRWVHVK